ncbi:MAG: hypothetical protein O7J95_05330 [Planctomycetota bacterium]|nr:hypothetical protein [Planctomycetota bacterium]
MLLRGFRLRGRFPPGPLALVVLLLSLLVETRAGRSQEVVEIGEAVVEGVRAVLPVRATTRAGPIQGFVISARFDPAVARVAELAPAGEWLAGKPPDFVRVVGTPDRPGDDGVAGLVVVLDVADDGVAKAIPAAPEGALQLIAEITVELLPDGPCDKPIAVELEDQAVRFDAGQAMLNTVVIGGRDYFAGSAETPLTLRSASFLPVCDAFVRGDVDSNGRIELTDGIVVLNFLFVGGVPPACMDAADANDDGGERPDLTDAVVIFNWLFLGGPPPAPPTPLLTQYDRSDCGPDPTDDLMDCALASPTCSP